MNIFYELIQVSLGRRNSLSRKPSDKEWEKLYLKSQQQAVSGIVFGALDELSKNGQKPPHTILYDWIGMSEQIRQRNILLNQRSVELSKMLGDAGFETCILKGQGNARMYSNPLLRQSGDIDVWINDSKEHIVSFVKQHYPQVFVSSHHVEYPVFDNVDVEMHYEPNYSFTWRHQKKLKKFVEEHRDEQFCNSVQLMGIENKINVPTDDFNIIFQLSHMHRHFFYGGIGLRHIIDFYYLLLHADGSKKKMNIDKLLSQLGLRRFTSAIMWVLLYVLNMEEKYLLVEPDKTRGQLVLNEMMRTGNLGHSEGRGFRRLEKYSMTLSVIGRNLRLVRLFPEEAVSAPISGVIQRFLLSG